MDKKRLLYIMGVDWDWIYQRPQILAEKLAQDYDVTVVFPRNILQCLKYRNVARKLNMRILWTIPYQEKIGFLGKISALMSNKRFRDINQFDLICIGYPIYERYIPEDYPGMILYDCMDDYEAIYPDRKRVYKVTEAEQKLVRRCDVLITSAKMLRAKMDGIAGYAKSVVIRNGVRLSDILEVKEARIKEQYSIGYIGTIAGWFDKELVEKSLAEISNINYQLIGPGEAEIEHSRVVYHGAMAHEMLAKAIEDYDCLVMPFQINDIVVSVDPVKLYEYIAFGKCIVSVYYEEIERFNDFVYFYRDAKEYVTLVKELAQKGFPPKYTTEQQREFLDNNTWDKRYHVLKSLIMAWEDKDED